MAEEITRNQENTIELSLKASSDGSDFGGDSLSNVSVTGVLYNDDGNPADWSITSEPTKDGTWRLVLTAAESDVDEAYTEGYIQITADEIYDYNLWVSFAVAQAAGSFFPILLAMQNQGGF